jgi:hypothetical protein
VGRIKTIEKPVAAQLYLFYFTAYKRKLLTLVKQKSQPEG